MDSNGEGGKRAEQRRAGERQVEALTANPLWDARSPARPPPGCVGFTTQRPLRPSPSNAPSKRGAEF